jgi:hypothetical protein
MTVIQDLITLVTKIKTGIMNIMSLFTWIKNILAKLKFWKKTITDVVETVDVPKVEKVGIVKTVKNIIFPRAKLTYWLADEEVIVYVNKFHQKDKFKLIYTELETGRQVMVNGANPINYRLEELKASDPVLPTEIQQNQRY